MNRYVGGRITDSARTGPAVLPRRAHPFPSDSFQHPPQFRNLVVVPLQLVPLPVPDQIVHVVRQSPHGQRLPVPLAIIPQSLTLVVEVQPSVVEPPGLPAVDVDVPDGFPSPYLKVIGVLGVLQVIVYIEIRLPDIPLVPSSNRYVPSGESYPFNTMSADSFYACNTTSARIRRLRRRIEIARKPHHPTRPRTT